jgi:ribosomal protein S18 acetylase RimI-like enzyme
LTDPRFLTEPLGRDHDRASFRCGHPELDAYLHRQAGQDVRRHLAAVFVMPAGSGDPRVVAYYTLSALAIDAGVLPEPLRHRIPYREVPAVLLGRLAVDIDHQRHGLGSLLVVDAVHRCLEPTAPASLAMVVDAIDEAATAWYRRFGFMPFGARPDRLFAPLETVRQAL